MSSTAPFNREEIYDENLLPQQLRDNILTARIEQMWKYEFPALEQELFIAVCEISTNNPAAFRAFGCFRTVGRTNWQMTVHSNTNHEPGKTLNELIIPFLKHIG